MLKFSDDPDIAEQEMNAIIFYLVTFGYIDGDFDAKEKTFVRQYIERLIDGRAQHAMPDAPAEVRKEIVTKYTRHFHEVFEGIDANVKELFTESVSTDEDPTAFVHGRLKSKCFEIFKSFDRGSQDQLMASIDELLMADGEAHPAEVAFRAELAQLLEADLDIELVHEDEPVPSHRTSVTPVVDIPRSEANHVFFEPMEQHFSKDRERILSQVEKDRSLIDRALDVLARQRKEGAGKLTGKQRVDELEGAFTDGHVVVRRPRKDQKHELIVLGDLHGCYSVLKAALMQSHFFEKVDAYRSNPKENPYPILVLLGDYIDRGLFSLNGVLRLVLQLFVTAPDHVVVLRGNHEYYIEHKGNMYGGVKPAEAINSLKPHLDIDVFRHYRTLFEALPNVFLFDRIFFVHGGIAKDRLLKERYKDLSSLNDEDIRFQMMWSDPSAADVIPADLQDKASRFMFGRMQFKAFMQKVGTTTMIRGHEKVNAGYHVQYDDDRARLVTLFSSGGIDNADLPAESTYRSVTPMALTITHDGSESRITPWAPHYGSYNDPERNAFFKMPPEIEHRA
ncbi:MAG: metallophosphoesterase family protein [Polyangiaceae bacterium]